MIRPVPFADAHQLAEAMSEEMKVLYDSDVGATPVEEAAFAPPGVFLVLSEPDGLSEPGQDVACGGLALLAPGIGEVKRMYVVPDRRGHGHSRVVLRALVDHARGVGLREVWLETGSRQAPAVGLYESEGFEAIPPYGYWKDHPETLCYRLVL